MSDIDPTVARWLTTTAGLEEVAAATQRLDDGDEELQVVQHLRDGGLDQPRTQAITAAAVARRRARGRWPEAEHLLFTRAGLEQASDPEVSRWRARRLASAGRDVLDVCAGVGGDSLALAAAGARVTAVDQDAGRLVLLEHNARVLGLEVRTQVADARLVPAAGRWVHGDPGRRRGDQRIRALRDYLPAVPDLVAAFRDAPALGLVLSPGVDLDDPDLPDGELEFVQLGGDLVEAVVWLGEARRTGAIAAATLLPQGDERVRASTPRRLDVGPVGGYLVEVAPAAVRARLHDQLGAELGATRVATTRALLSVTTLPPPSAWYRTRAVEAVLPAHPGPVKRWLRQAEPRPLEIVLHGIDASPKWWWRALGRPPRGPRGRRIELIRTDEGAIAVVTTGLDDGGGT